MQDIERRLEAVFGPWRWKAAFSRASGYASNSDFLRAMRSGNRVPPVLLVAVEFLETVPRSKWPDRWAELRDGSNAHDKKMREETE